MISLSINQEARATVNLNAHDINDTIIHSTFIPTTYTQEDLYNDLEAVFDSLPTLKTASLWSSTVQPVLTESYAWNERAIDTWLEAPSPYTTAPNSAWDCKDADDLIDAWIEGSTISPFDFLPSYQDAMANRFDHSILVRGFIR